MYDVFRLLEHALNRGEMLTPRYCLVALACLTLVSYLVLLVSGRSRA
jgi:hypothetical protein